MIFLSMPVGSSHGWGICGKYITREMWNVTGGNSRLITQQVTVEAVGDELEFQAIAAAICKPGDVAGAKTVNGVMQLEGPLLACVVDKRMGPWMANLRGRRTVGYTFFEENVLRPEWIENARRNFDVVATGSTWCTDVLKENGLTDVHTVIQGVDGRVFRAAGSREEEEGLREFMKDRFVIFSGGKFEYRKGQDVVIRAVRVMQERHKDVVLVNAWANPWQASFDTMKASPHLKWPVANGGFVEVMNRVLAENGLDVARVVTLAQRPNALMARIYHNSDVGIFPNRCEGGTNLVLMEYMACGKPVVATATTGHADVVNAGHAAVIAIKGGTEVNKAGEGLVARWPEPDVEDAIEKLEWVYQHREEAREMGRRGAAEMKKLTWEESARGFERLLEG